MDGLVDITGNIPRLAGALFWPIQNGLVQYYALLMILGLTVFLLALIVFCRIAMTTLLLFLLILPLIGAVAAV